MSRVQIMIACACVAFLLLLCVDIYEPDHKRLQSSWPAFDRVGRKLTRAENVLFDSSHPINWHTPAVALQKEKQYTLVYVHAALTEGGAGPDILREQLQHIKASGLWDSMHHLFLGVLGDVSLVPQEFLKDGKLSLIFDTPELDFFEFPTLHTLQTHAKRIFPESNMLYIHTKGVNRRPLAREWRELLMFCLVDNWQTCLADVFGAGFETCGCQLQGGPDGFPVHYSGNFWWTKASVAAEAPDIWSYRGTQDRMECEFWLLGRVQDYELSKSKHYCLWHSHRNMYDVATAKNEYESQDFLPVRPNGQCP